MIGVVAVFGWAGLKDGVKKIATATAEKSIAEYLEKQDFKDKIRGEVAPLPRVEKQSGVNRIPYLGEEEKGHGNSDNKPE